MPALFQRLWRSKIILVFELILIAALGVSLGKQIFKKQSIGGEIGKLEADIGKLEKQKNDLTALLDYVKTDGFVEAEARNKLNLAKPGENLVLIPAGDSDPAAPPEAAASGPTPASRPSNLVKWWQYFFEHNKLWQN